MIKIYHQQPNLYLMVPYENRKEYPAKREEYVPFWCKRCNLEKKPV